MGVPKLGQNPLSRAIKIYVLRAAVLVIIAIAAVGDRAQFIMHPGVGATDPNSPSGQRIPDALVFGMRMTLQWEASAIRTQCNSLYLRDGGYEATRPDGDWPGGSYRSARGWMGASADRGL